MSEFSILIEKDGKKLLLLQGPIDMVGDAAIGLLQREKLLAEPVKEPKPKRQVLRFSAEESKALREAVIAGKRGPELRAVAPSREPASIRSHILGSVHTGHLTQGMAELAVKNLAVTSVAKDCNNDQYSRELRLEQVSKFS